MVSNVVIEALEADEPRRRYMAVSDVGRAENTMRALLKRMVELNRDQAFTYSEAQLVEMFKEEYSAP